jgi:hypothetical protein
MKTRLAFCAAVIIAVSFAAQASAQAANYIPHNTTITRLTNFASDIVVGELLRVDNVQLEVVGDDAKRNPRSHDGKFRDGEEYVRRDAVIRVNQVLKGDATAGEELSFVSIRQLRLPAYSAELRNGPAIYFLYERSDGLLAVPSDERGTVNAAEVDGRLGDVVNFILSHIEQPVVSAATLDRLLGSIDLRSGRLSVDAALELSWHFEEYGPAINAEHGAKIIELAEASKVGSNERNELITAIGRYKPQGGFETVMNLVLTDASWPTTSLGCFALGEIDRRGAIEHMLGAWETAESTDQKIAIVRSLGLIRPKADFDGPALRHQTLQLIESQLNAETESALLRESLIASRDLRAETAHIDALKKLIDERHTNGIDGESLRGALIALAAARTKVWTPDGLKQVIHAEDYLTELADSDRILAQVIRPALDLPWVALIVGADGKGH